MRLYSYNIHSEKDFHKNNGQSNLNLLFKNPFYSKLGRSEGMNLNWIISWYNVICFDALLHYFLLINLISLFIIILIIVLNFDCFVIILFHFNIKNDFSVDFASFGEKIRFFKVLFKTIHFGLIRGRVNIRKVSHSILQGWF